MLERDTTIVNYQGLSRSDEHGEDPEGAGEAPPLRRAAHLARHVVISALAAASLGLSYIVPAASGSAQDNTGANPPFMPDLRLADGSGLPFALSRYKGAVIVLEFWSTSCGPCLRDLDALNHLQGDFPGRPLLVIPVNEDPGPIQQVKAALARQKLTFLRPYADPNGAAAQFLNLRGLPTSFVIDRLGRMVLQIEGPQSWNGAEMEKRVNFLLSQSPQ